MHRMLDYLRVKPQSIVRQRLDRLAAEKLFTDVQLSEIWGRLAIRQG